MSGNQLVLVTGATGYVGGRLVPKLLDAGYRVRCLVRDPARLDGRTWHKRVEIVRGDATQAVSVEAAFRDVYAAYYLIHGMQGGRPNAEHDLQMARNFIAAADRHEVQRVIYLGELVDPTARLSPYLRSRHETGLLLRQSRISITEFRAGMIIGSGSALFEMIRYLTEREPVLVCPAWFFSMAQPIGIRDVLRYLVDALSCPESAGSTLEIGGPQRLTYAQMLLEYAAERGLKRSLIRTPFQLPRLSAYWVHMVTPIHWRSVLPLIEGLRANLVVHDDEARRLFPGIHPLDFRQAVHEALGRVLSDVVETSWSDALVNSAGDTRPYEFAVEEGMMIERRSAVVDVPASAVFRAYAGIGGQRGWLFMDWAWAIRGWMDKAVGGVGIRRGRRHPDEIRAGESLDFWRVESVERDRLLRLRAEMKVPGKAWLQFESTALPHGQTLLVQTAYYAPRGLLGFLYWYAMWPFHAFLFDGLIRRVSASADACASAPTHHVINGPVLVTGANGFIASRLIPRLLKGGYAVRVLVRRAETLVGRAWLPEVEVRAGSTSDEASMAPAMQGVHTAYYLVHNMSRGRGYIEIERESAMKFAAAAAAAGVQHIIYLGGLADPHDPHLAPHMRSRIETGKVLRQGKVPVTEFRAGVIAGAGSISFEMVRFLTECFPILPGPRWLQNLAQPIASENVIDYLLAGLEKPEARDGIYEMGGPEQMQFGEVMLRYARYRGLKRHLFTVPGIPIWWMALVVDRLTPVPRPIATALIGGLQSDSRVLNDGARQMFPQIRLLTFEQAIQVALGELVPERLERVWEGLERDAANFRHEGFIVDYRIQTVNAPASAVFAFLMRMGGPRQWPYASWMWRLRGWSDRVLWPKAPRRADPWRSPDSASVSEDHNPKVGNRLDYYRIEVLEQGRLVRLRSLLRMPGEGWLEWRVQQQTETSARLTQTAFFAPRGLPGFLYWLALRPFHQVALRGLITAIAKCSESA